MRALLFLTVFAALIILWPGPVTGPILALAQPREGEWERVLDLRGTWRFQIGDDLDWANAALDDEAWDEVFVPSNWEDEGFPGYDGFAWYRRTFRLDGKAKGQHLYLRLGRIDDTDGVYVNGHFVGTSGSFPPDYKTGYHQFRSYRIPESVLRYGGDNVIAVRIFDEGGPGGIVEGPIGLYVRTDLPDLVVDLTGLWSFRPGDNLRWKDEKVSESGWKPIQVPGRWEPQGYEGLDGFAWYRTRFFVPANARRDDLILLLGQIDDLDEAYLNGVRIGRTGDLQRHEIQGDEWQRLRTYPLPQETLHYGAYNSLAVRVYDGLIDGGIYEGPLGLATPAALEDWARRAEPGFWRVLKEWLMGWE
jgi:hypothetical protein